MQENVQRHKSILSIVFSFEPKLVHVYIPVAEISQKVELLFQNCIEPVMRELLVNERKNFLSLGQNPLIKNVFKLIVTILSEKRLLILEMGLSEVLITVDFLSKQSHELIPRKEDL